LSYETLTSKPTPKALRAYLKQDSIFSGEIRVRLGANVVDSLPDDIPVGGRREEENLDSDIDGDDTDVALSDVIRTALGPPKTATLLLTATPLRSFPLWYRK
jgi:hypothetical protein